MVGVAPGSPSAEAGLEEGDVLLELNDHPVRTPEECQSQLREARGTGRPLLVQVLRNGTTSYLALELPKP